MQNWKLSITAKQKDYPIHWEDLEQWKDADLPIDDVIPGQSGEAASFMRILEELSLGREFSYALFRAEDGFEQRVPIDQLTSAFLLFKLKGEPLSPRKGYPVRLYVLSSDSDCLNVKNVVQITLE